MTKTNSFEILVLGNWYLFYLVLGAWDLVLIPGLPPRICDRRSDARDAAPR
jgi:hypothetical protein